MKCRFLIKPSQLLWSSHSLTGVSLCLFPRMVAQVSYLRWLLLLLRRLLITIWIYICRGRKLGRVGTQRDDIFDLGCVVPSASLWDGLCPQIPWGPCAVVPWRAPRHRGVSCWWIISEAASPYRFPRGEGGEEEGCAVDAASGQRAPLLLCCAVLEAAASLGSCCSCSAQRRAPPHKIGRGSRFRLKQQSVTEDIRRLKQEWADWAWGLCSHLAPLAKLNLCQCSVQMLCIS